MPYIDRHSEQFLFYQLMFTYLPHQQKSPENTWMDWMNIKSKQFQRTEGFIPRSVILHVHLSIAHHQQTFSNIDANFQKCEHPLKYSCTNKIYFFSFHFLCFFLKMEPEYPCFTWMNFYSETSATCVIFK